MTLAQKCTSKLMKLTLYLVLRFKGVTKDELFLFIRIVILEVHGTVEYSSKCRRKLLKILARIQSSPGTLNVQRVFSDSFLQEIQRSSIFVFPSDV